MQETGKRTSKKQTNKNPPQTNRLYLAWEGKQFAVWSVSVFVFFGLFFIKIHLRVPECRFFRITRTYSDIGKRLNSRKTFSFRTY